MDVDPHIALVAHHHGRERRSLKVSADLSNVEVPPINATNDELSAIAPFLFQGGIQKFGLDRAADCVGRAVKPR